MRRSLTVASVLAAVSLAGCVWLAVTFDNDRSQSFLVWGWWDPDRLFVLLALLAAVSLFVVLALALSQARRIAKAGPRRIAKILLWAALIMGTPAAAFYLFFAAIGANSTYTEVRGADLTRDLVVREWSFLYAGGGHVFERSGSSLSLVGRTSTDDGYMPFADGKYLVQVVDGTTTLLWPFHSGGPIDTTVELD